MPNAVAVWKCVDSAIQRMATFTGGQTTVSAYLRLQTERINYGELIIQKTSEDGKKSGFTFKVTRDTDNWSVTVKTDDNGTAKISELPVFRGGTSAHSVHRDRDQHAVFLPPTETADDHIDLQKQCNRPV